MLEASISFSGISPAVEHKGSLYFSGDSVYENDVLSVINHCESLGYAEKDIVIDTIVSGMLDVTHFNPKGANSFSILRRSSELFKYYQHMHGILRAKDGHRNVNFRYVIGPSFSLPSKFMPLQYGEKETKKLFSLGESDAESVIYRLLYHTDEEIEKRIKSPLEIRYYNKDRQQRHEESMKTVFKEFIGKELEKIDQAKKRLGEAAPEEESPVDSIVDQIL